MFFKYSYLPALLNRVVVFIVPEGESMKIYHNPFAVQPPSTNKSIPVTYLEVFEARNIEEQLGLWVLPIFLTSFSSTSLYKDYYLYNFLWAYQYGNSILLKRIWRRTGTILDNT